MSMHNRNSGLIQANISDLHCSAATIFCAMSHTEYTSVDFQLEVCISGVSHGRRSQYCPVTTYSVSPRNALSGPHISNYKVPRTISYEIYGDSLLWNIHVWSPSVSVCPPGPYMYILNPVLKYAIPLDHSWRNISPGGSFISKYCTGMVPPLRRVSPRQHFSNCISEIYSRPIYCLHVVLQGNFSVMYCPPGVSSVVLILAKLLTIDFLCTAVFLSLERPAGYTPVTLKQEICVALKSCVF